MAKASPALRSFNAGEFSVLMQGRTDVDRYPASLRELRNFITAPQGPVIRRSGTVHVARSCCDDSPSCLVPFVFARDQALNVEVSDGMFRFVTEDGVVTYDEVYAAVVSTEPLVINAPDLGAEVGDQVALSGFPVQASLEGYIAHVTAVDGDEYTLDVSYSDAEDADAAPKAARVYIVDAPYDADDLSSIRYLQSADVLYLFCEGKQPYTLSRFGALDWRAEPREFINGPYLDQNDEGVTLTPSGTANRAALSLGTATNLGHAEGHPADDAFDTDQGTWWQSDTDQRGRLEFTPTTPFACDGYAIFVARDNANTLYTNKDYAPADWTFEGWDGTKWVTLDAQNGYVLYDGMRSTYFKLNNSAVYSKYALQVTACNRNGPLAPRVGQLVMTSADSKSLTLTASGTDGVNKDAGFAATDVGRLIRAKCSDGFWRNFRVTARSSATVVTATLLDDPLPNTGPMLDWRLGYWSDTTGWPTCGVFFEDRMWLGGGTEYPDLIAGSVTGAYDNYAQSDRGGEVLDESAVVVRLTNRELGRVRWLQSDERGLLVGTSAGNWVLSSADSREAINPRSLRARPSTARGAADVEAVKVDRQVLYVQRSRRTMREFAYVYEADGYKEPSMTQFASHIGSPYFAQIAYAAEPYSIVWVRRVDGTVAALTYNRDENVIGWHQHDFGGVVESISVLPTSDQRQDALWLVVNRDGVRSIERMTAFWDFGSTLLADAHYVDDGLRYSGAAIDTVYGLRHLEGAEVVGLVNGVPYEFGTVTDGSVPLPEPATNVVVGLNFTSRLVSAGIEAGAADGTAQGKDKRVHGIAFHVWDSAGGDFGTVVDGDERFNPLPYSDAPFEEVDPIRLHTGFIGPVTPAAGYGKDAVLIVQSDEPTPLNVIAILPQLHTQDR